jgi:hypothetical protein
VHYPRVDTEGHDGDGAKAALPSTPLVEKGVPERPDEVAEVVLGPEEARPAQEAGVRLLDEVLRVLPLAARAQAA